MNIAEMLGTPVADPADTSDPTRAGCTVPAPIEQVQPPARRRRTWLWTSLIAVLALAAGVAMGSYFGAEPGPQTPDTMPTPASSPPAALGSFAEMVTALHLSGNATPADLESLYAGPASASTASGLWINRAAAVAIEPLGEDYWLVTVAVDALEMNDGSYEAAGVQYYDITIVTDADRPLAVSAPARVPSPPAAAVPDGIPPFSDVVPADQAMASNGFLNAYLTGSGELARFVSPTAPIRPFPTAPYESIEVLSLGSDSLGRIRAAVEAQTTRGGHQTLEYTLEMIFESGVWEVSNLITPVDVRS